MCVQVLTAYARECERAGVRIPRWRDSTGCRHVVPFKYSGEQHFFHSGEMGQTAQANAAQNEVLSLDDAEVDDDGGGDGGEETDQERLDMARVGRRKEAVGGVRTGLGAVGAALAAYRPPKTSVTTPIVPISRSDLLLDESSVERLMKSDDEEKDQSLAVIPYAVDLRSHRKRQRRMRRLKRQKKKREKKRRREQGGGGGEGGGPSAAMRRGGGNKKTPSVDNEPATIGTFNGVIVQRVPNGDGVGGSGETFRNKLRWGGRSRGDDSPPPFELLLAADDENEDEGGGGGGGEDEEDDEDDEELDDETDPNVDDSGITFIDPGGTAATTVDNSTSPIQRRPKMDLSDKLGGLLASRGTAKAGRTPIPLLDSGELVVSHRRFQRRRRSDSSLSDVANRRNWKRRRPLVAAIDSEERT